MNLEKISSVRLNALSTAASAFMPSLINSAQAAPRNSRPLASHGVGSLAWVGSGVLLGHASRGRATIGVRRCRCGASVARSRKH